MFGKDADVVRARARRREQERFFPLAKEAHAPFQNRNSVPERTAGCLRGMRSITLTGSRTLSAASSSAQPAPRPEVRFNYEALNPLLKK